MPMQSFDATRLARLELRRASVHQQPPRPPRVGPQHNHAKSALRGTSGPWAVSRYSTRWKARGPRATQFKVHDYDLLKPVAMPSPHWPRWPTIQQRSGCTAWRACSVRGRPMLHGANRPWAARPSTERNGHGLSNSVLPTRCGVGAIEPRPTAWGGARPALAHNTSTQSAHCAARAPWLVGRYSTGRTTRGSRARGFERSGHDLSKPVPATSRGVGAVAPRPMA